MLPTVLNIILYYLGQENKIHCFSGPPASVQLPPGFYFILNVQARDRPRPGALWHPISEFAFARARYSIGHAFSMLTRHCVVLRPHAFSRSRDRLLKPRSTTMLVSTRVLIQNGRRTHVVRGWRVVSIPKEDARRTDIAACIPVFTSMTTIRWSHSVLRLDQGMFPVPAVIGRAQSAMDFQDVSLQRLRRGSVFVYLIFVKKQQLNAVLGTN